MRIKVTKGSDPLGLTTYLLNPQKQKEADRQAGHSPLLDTNMFGSDAYELAEEFRFSHDLKRRVKRTMVHYSVSLPPEEQVSDDQKAAIALDLLKQMGHGDCQYFVVAHHDQVHKNKVEHWHVATSAVDLNGQWVPDHFNYSQLKNVERDLEQKYGLQFCPPKPEKERQNLSSGEHRLKQKTEAMLPKEKLWQAIDSAASDQPTMPVLVTRLKAAGVEVKFHDTDHNRKHKGISFAIDGSNFQGGKLGKAYSLGGLKEHRGVDYEPGRDDEQLRELNGLSTEDCRWRSLPERESRLGSVQLQQAAPEPPEVQVDQTALAHQQEPQRQVHEQELTLHTTPASSDPEAATPQPESLTSAPNPPKPVVPDFDPHAAARSMLQHFRQRLKTEKRKKLTTPDGYCATIDNSRSITITRQSPDGTQKLIAQDEKTSAGWKVAIAQVTPEEWQTFSRYQKAREVKQKQSKQSGIDR